MKKKNEILSSNYTLICKFGGEGSRKEIDEKDSDFAEMVMTNVGLIDKGDELPYV